MNWYLHVWQNWNNFSGRSRRTEFWVFALGNILVSTLIWFLELMVGALGFLSYVFSLAVIVPYLAVGVRRLHDTGREGLWIIGSFIPLLNLVILYFMALDSEPGANQYGANPKGM